MKKSRKIREKLAVKKAVETSPIPRRRETATWYFVCAVCEAKWFFPENDGVCPRCGAESTSNENIVPPWRRQADELQ